MALFSSRPSRNYASVEHDPDGLSSVGNLPFGSRKVEGGFKTYRPSIVESHLRRPDAGFNPLPPAFQSHRHKKEAARAGQRAELDRILEPEYKSIHSADPDSGGLIIGPSLARSGVRTAGGLSADRKGRSLRSSSSVGSFPSAGKKFTGNSGTGAGVYLDSDGKMHDSEFDPFAKVSEMSRNMSRRRSAFGSDRRRGSGSSSSSSEEGSDGVRGSGSRHSGASGREREEEEIRKRLESERRRLDEVSGYTAAKRRSMVPDRASGGKGTPSLRSSEDGDRHTIQSAYTSGYGYGHGGRSKSNQGYYVRSPLSPTFGQPESANSYTTSRTLPTTMEDPAPMGTPEKPQKVTEITSGIGALEFQDEIPLPDDADEERRERMDEAQKQPPQIQRNGFLDRPRPLGHGQSRGKERDRQERVEIRKDGSRKITGFDAPSSPMPQHTLSPEQQQQQPSSAGPSTSMRVLDLARSNVSRASSESHRPKPVERPREELFPETPAQMKRREERAARANRSGAGAGSNVGLGIRAGPSPRPESSRSRYGPLAVDTALAGRSVTRALPEIEIVEDDDPRVIIPSDGQGRTTRVQTTHDHVIRGPFSLALQAMDGAGEGGGPVGIGGGADRRPSSTRSIPFSGAGQGSGPSSILEEGAGGYLPSRWASGDKQLRRTEEEKEQYRPKEWGGKAGDLAGKPEEWKPTSKEQIKRTWKDVQTSARFSLFRATKKLARKADI